jgi:hypothetical protein
MGKCDLSKEVAESWGLEVKERGLRVMSGDLCVGVVDCSKFSEFAKLNGKITKEDWEEAEEMVKKLEVAQKAGGVVVCCLPKRSAIWRMQSMKTFGGKHEIWSAEFDGCSLGVTSRTRTKDRAQHWRNQLKVVSYSEVLVDMMRVRCGDNHRHRETRGSEGKV